MEAPLSPLGEPQRLGALWALELLDTPPEERFDAVTRLARRLFDVPISLVTLLDEDRQWFKSKQGIDVCSTPRWQSFCGHAILQDEVFVVEDTLADPRFHDNPLVTGPPHIRFYAGCPLRHAGQPLGTLCIIDAEPRAFGTEERTLLRDLNALVEHEVDATALRIERDRQEGQLRDVATRFQGLADNISQLAWTKDARGETITWANRRCIDYTGKTLEQLREHGWSALIHPEHAERVERKHREHVAAGLDWEDTFPLRGRHGEYRWFLARAVLGHDGSGAAAWFCTYTDITAQRAVEQALRVSEKELREREAALTEGDRRKDEFLATLAHELRNPLASIRSAAHALTLPELGPTALERAGGIIERQSGHMARLVDDLLDVSRITLGRIEFQLHPENADALVAAAVDGVRAAATAKQQVLNFVPAGEALQVDVDATRMSQAIGNLLGNAVKYTPQCGRIDVAVRRAGDQVRIEIRDDGIGIAPENLPRVFNMFVQERRGSEGGLGIGLALARRLVEMHGGTLSASSAGRGHGSTFAIELPLQLAAMVHDDRGARPSAAGARHVLIVEDNEDAAASLQIVLQLDGHRVEVAADAAAALEQIEAHLPDVVLLDIGLPDMDGYELARLLRRRFGARCPVLVAMTGWGEDGHRQRTREAGFSHHLTKPVDPRVVKEVLKLLRVV